MRSFLVLRPQVQSGSGLSVLLSVTSRRGVRTTFLHKPKNKPVGSPDKIASRPSQFSTTNYQLPQPWTPLNSLIHTPRLAYTPLMKAPFSSTASLPRDSHPARLCLCA